MPSQKDMQAAATFCTFATGGPALFDIINLISNDTIYGAQDFHLINYHRYIVYIQSINHNQDAVVCGIFLTFRRFWEEIRFRCAAVGVATPWACQTRRGSG